MKLYPAWLETLRPDLNRVLSPVDVDRNNYYIFSGNGFPSLLHNHLENAVADVNQIGRFSSFVIILDADDATSEGRTKEVIEFYTGMPEPLAIGIRFVVIVQNKCIETWLLGNQKMFKRNPQSKTYREYINYYDVQGSDPEFMGPMPPFEYSAQFHVAYLSEMFIERNQRYSKRNPGVAASQSYLDGLSKRSEQGDLKSFQGMLDAISNL